MRAASRQHPWRSRLTVLGLAGVFLSHWAAAQQSQPAASAAAPPAFEVASLRLVARGDHGTMSFSEPGQLQYTARNVPLHMLLQIAFGVESYQIISAPSWSETELYDIAAKPAGETGLTFEQLKQPLQQLFQQRMHLTWHRETRSLPGYALVVAKGGAKLSPSKGHSGLRYLMPTGIRADDIQMKTLAAMLAVQLERPVADETGLEGNFDIKLEYAAEDAADSSGPSLFTAMQEQLGLKLQSQKVPVEMVVIDHVDRVPAEN